VRIVLLEKSLCWEKLVDLTRMEQKRPEYLALNPNGLVPTLVHGDRVIYESNVITEYREYGISRSRGSIRVTRGCARRPRCGRRSSCAMAKE
jgi:hypothetical protein